MDLNLKFFAVLIHMYLTYTAVLRVDCLEMRVSGGGLCILMGAQRLFAENLTHTFFVTLRLYFFPHHLSKPGKV